MTLTDRKQARGEGGNSKETLWQCNDLLIWQQLCI